MSGCCWDPRGLKCSFSRGPQDVFSLSGRETEPAGALLGFQDPAEREGPRVQNRRSQRKHTNRSASKSLNTNTHSFTGGKLCATLQHREDTVQVSQGVPSGNVATASSNVVDANHRKHTLIYAHICQAYLHPRLRRNGEQARRLHSDRATLRSKNGIVPLLLPMPDEEKKGGGTLTMRPNVKDVISRVTDMTS